MNLCLAESERASTQPVQVLRMETTRKLLDGLIAYRSELGETGLQLELLLRQYGVVASTDVAASLHTH